jgi:branched-chain amino acid transport system permease protein
MRLSTESVTKSFAGLKALSEISIAIEQGEIVGIIGPNGSGKTTLINVISGVLPPTSGTIQLGDDDLSGLPSHDVARRGISRTFQTIRLFSEMTVLENVEVAACGNPATKGWTRPRRTSREALARLDLERHADSIVTTLPYGLQRRVEIARAVSTRPSFVLLDEPAAGMNESESDDLLATLLSLREALGFGALLIDHDLRLIMRATDRIYVLNEGKLLATGTPDEVRNNRDVIRAYIGGGEDVKGKAKAKTKATAKRRGGRQ